MKAVLFTALAARQLVKHANVRERIEGALARYASDSSAGANNVTRMVGSAAYRMRIGDFRVTFTDDGSSITVVKIGPRGDVYEAD